MHLPANAACQGRRGVGIATINFNTPMQTLRCLESLRYCTEAPEWVVVLDNASNDDKLQSLLADFPPYQHSELFVFRAEENSGYAGGSNFLIEFLLAQPLCRHVMLLNNDAVAKPGLISLLVDAVCSSSGRIGLAGGRMHRLVQPEEVDTLGITLYASLMPANRLSLDDPYLGPTGGCCLLTRDFLVDLKRTTGHWFDERFFCYCEDTDLVLRALLLGYRPAYVDELVALHEGQASTGGGYNKFIAYHGIRNSIWMQVKAIPSRLLIKYGILLLAAHAMTIMRHLVAGQPRLLFDVYRDARRGFSSMRKERRLLGACARISMGELDAYIARRFYRRGYLGVVFSQVAMYYRGLLARR